MTASTDRPARWEAPGPGSWVIDRSHSEPSPTLLYRRMVSQHTAPAYEGVLAERENDPAATQLQTLAESTEFVIGTS